MSGYSADTRIRWAEWLPWVAAGAFFFVMPEYLSLGARILIFILFALSLDLILGYAGIVTLGHSAFFGLGAYTAGILSAKLGINDPFLGLAAAAAMSAALGLLTRALTLLMLTLAITAILLEIANKWSTMTGGADGLSGVQVSPILGLFRFDLYGRTAFLYCLVALFIGWFVIRRIIYSPYGAM